MAACDLCGAAMLLEESTACTLQELRAAVSRGLEPPERALARAAAAGLSRELALTRWKDALARADKSTWVLCRECAARMAGYRPRPVGTRLASRFGPEPAAPASETDGERAPAAARRGAALAVSPSGEEAEEEQSGPARGPLPLLAVLVGGVVIVAVVLLTVLFLTGHLGGAPAALPLPLPTATLAPTAVPTRPTATLPPAATPVPDLSAAMLVLPDLPAGFQVLSAEEQVEAGMTEEEIQLLWNEGFSEAQVVNLTSFYYPSPVQFEIIASWLLYPLTPDEQARLDRELVYPLEMERLTWVFGVNPPPMGTISEMNLLGDASVGLTYADPAQQPPARVELAMVRRGPVLEMTLVMYEDGTRPTVGLRWLALQLDKRVAAGLGQ